MKNAAVVLDSLELSDARQGANQPTVLRLTRVSADFLLDRLAAGGADKVGSADETLGDVVQMG